MNIPEFLDLLKAQLSKLSNDDVAAFAISICNRLLPYYLEFHEHSTWGNPNTLLEAVLI
ncbi:DUF416 family protein [Pontibacter sp. HSC-14F20]|uniref:DUF416 family protein n=1 Tax=Pontibacter sp. HSC-14F20 TaxID=2864136 RepID=UPI001C737FF3|nr:DUF416 family protein [Pontibacter sp. HSC-14F20]MBX0334650.1 DUF416 family protein [Pontibacter sp. HSC-14F20]